jgi:hypothetical protein
MTRPSRLSFTLSLLVVFASTSALTADQGCDTNEQIYQNSSSSTMVVTGEFTDGCKDADSSVDVYKKGDKPGDTPTVSGTVKDMHTINLTLDVPPGGSMYFNCRGTGQHLPGSCSSRLISALPK